MGKKREKAALNYLDFVPTRAQSLEWRTEDDGNVTLLVENKGLFNRAAQKLLKKPKVTQVHLDETGSFVWPLIDGEKSISQLAQDVDARFGEQAAPLYERLAKFFRILESYRFVAVKRK